MIVHIVYDTGSMTVDLKEVFYPDEAKEKVAIKYGGRTYKPMSDRQRVTGFMKILHDYDYMNEKTFNDCLEWLTSEKAFLEDVRKTVANNWASQSKGSRLFTQYKKKFNQLDKKIKLFDHAINVLRGVK